MSRIRISSLTATATLIVFSAAVAAAQTTAVQQFLVSVQQSISITAPSNISLTHDLTNNPQSFPAQSWQVQGNIPTGVTVNFSVNTPFYNTTNNTFRRDAKLSLATGTVSGPGVWIVSQPTDSTNYVAGTNTAVVSARSNTVGRANMLLTVTFVTGDTSMILAGNYVTTVTGTVTANP